MRTKYYYDGHLIRTTESRKYTHAVITPDYRCIACRNGLDAAEQAKEAEKADDRRAIRNAEHAIRALKAGAKRVQYTGLCRMKFWHVFDESDTVEKYEEKIQRALENMKRIDAYLVVELEAR